MDNGSENPWRESEALPEGRYGMGSAGTVDQLYLVGGMGNMTESAPMLVYLSQTEDWESVSTQQIVVGSNLELVNLGTKLFMIGGEIKKSPLNRTMAYRAIYIISLPYVR